jgi:hypothetical protein
MKYVIHDLYLHLLVQNLIEHVHNFILFIGFFTMINAIVDLDTNHHILHHL